MILFFGGGYCTEFLVPLLGEKKIISTHSRIPYKAQFKDFDFVERYKLNDFLKQKKNYFPKITHILVSIPPGDKGDLVVNEICDDRKILKKIKWIGYFSTTGVYGDHGGRWVSENSELKTKNKRSMNRIKAEEQYLDIFKNHGLPSHIFRLPGIYGPNRSIFERLQDPNFRYIDKKNQFFSRIHVEDIANFIFKSMQKPTPGNIFNLTDNYPCELEEILIYACNLLKKNMPKKISLDSKLVSEMTKSFYKENKKVSNQKIKKVLGSDFFYPTYKSGLRAIFNKYYKYQKNLLK